MTQRHHFSDKIQKIDRDIIRMGTRVEEAVTLAIQALVEKDTALAQSVIMQDEEINSLEIQIQDELTILIATEQPVAKDLRHVITSLKIVAQLERMGDQAVHIAKATCDIADQEYVKPLIDIPKMAEIGVGMLQDVLSAFTESDDAFATAIAKRDDSVDNLRDQIIRELFTYMVQDMQKISQITSLIYIARWLERFADHVTNICEWVVYDSIGKHVELNL